MGLYSGFYSTKPYTEVLDVGTSMFMHSSKFPGQLRFPSNKPGAGFPVASNSRKPEIIVLTYIEVRKWESNNIIHNDGAHPTI